MQTAQYSGTDALIQSAIDAAQALDNNQAISLPGGYIIARSNTGKFWFGHGFGSPRWYRGDGIELMREQLPMCVTRTLGYHATRFRDDLRLRLENPRHWRSDVENVGRRTFRIVRETA